MRFEVYYMIGNTLRQTTIKAQDLEDAGQKCNRLFKRWVDIIYANKDNAREAYAS